jgi:hypothetical protein
MCTCANQTKQISQETEHASLLTLCLQMRKQLDRIELRLAELQSDVEEAFEAACAASMTSCSADDAYQEEDEDESDCQSCQCE